jgi:hypothetical protein
VACFVAKIGLIRKAGRLTSGRLAGVDSESWPLVSLGGETKRFQSDEEYKEFIFNYGMEEFFLLDY